MSDLRPIYLDYNATTPVDPRVVDAMLPYLAENFGNASSAHRYGYEARQAVEDARERVARLVGASPDEIIFTGGGSESDNLALKGTVLARLVPRPHVVASTIEHPAILNVLQYLRFRFGVDVTLVPVDEYGLVSVEAVQAAIRPQTVLLTIMFANNEVGTIQPIDSLGRLARESGILFHVDGAQAVGKVPIDVRQVPIDLLTIAGHKLHAPKGVGALFVRRGVSLDPVIHGGSQERGLRAGTENVASVVAIGVAAQLAREDMAVEEERLRELRDTLHDRLQRSVPGLALNGHPERRLPNTLNVSFPGVIGQAVLDLTPEVAASTGSACHSGATEPSSVLVSMGLPLERALGAVRLSLGRWTTEDDVHRAARSLAAGYARLVPLAPAG
jgi:cysteine desulfurase